MDLSLASSHTPSHTRSLAESPSLSHRFYNRLGRNQEQTKADLGLTARDQPIGAAVPDPLFAADRAITRDQQNDGSQPRRRVRSESLPPTRSNAVLADGLDLGQSGRAPDRGLRRHHRQLVDTATDIRTHARTAT